MTPSYKYVAYVENIVDGDTVDLAIDCGFRIQFRDRFRLYGIDAPERYDDGGREATAYLKDILPIGSKIIVYSHKDTRGKYGRWIGTLYLDETKDSINRMMVDSGHAVYKEY